jgi:hypothetical protein
MRLLIAKLIRTVLSGNISEATVHHRPSVLSQ